MNKYSVVHMPARTCRIRTIHAVFVVHMPACTCTICTAYSACTKTYSGEHGDNGKCVGSIHVLSLVLAAHGDLGEDGTLYKAVNNHANTSNSDQMYFK
jgi:hypothetical protein